MRFFVVLICLIGSASAFASETAPVAEPAAPAVDCERPIRPGLELWRQCKMMRFIGFTGLEFRGPQREMLTCFRCTFRQLRAGPGKVSIGIRESRIIGGRLEGADFSGVFGLGVKARGLRATRTSFENSDWTAAYFAEARFIDVSFRDAILKGVDFSGAILDGVDLRGADLSQALLTRTRFNNIRTDAKTRFPEGFHWQP